MPTSVPIFSFLVRLVSEISGPKIKSGSSWFPQTPPSGQIFIQGLVRVNDYKCAKFQLPSSITEIWKGSQNKNWELLITSDAPLTVKFLHVAIVPTNAYQRTKFQLPSSISFRDKEGVPTFNVRATSPLPYPVRWNFYVCSKYSARSNSAPNFSIVSMHRSVMRINVKNFNWSLTTVVRGQNDTSKAANITDTTFDRTLI